MHARKVKGREIGPKGIIEGSFDDPILNTVLHDVEFPNGKVKDHLDNFII